VLRFHPSACWAPMPIARALPPPTTNLGGSMPTGPRLAVREPERLVGHSLPPPQRGQRAVARLKASHPAREWGKRNRESFVVVAGQPERAGAQTHVEPASASGLGHRQLRREEERVAKADVQDPDGYGDPLRPSSHPRRGESVHPTPLAAPARP
jgi:hypothetical protein